MTGVGGQASVALSPTTLSFSQAVNTTGTSQVTLTNPGTIPLQISSVQVSGAAFSETNNCGISVAAGGSCVINVNFSPTAIGNSTGTLTIADSAAGSPHTVALTAKGLAAGVGLAYAPNLGSTFPTAGTVAAGSSTSTTVQVGGAGPGQAAYRPHLPPGRHIEQMHTRRLDAQIPFGRLGFVCGLTAQRDRIRGSERSGSLGERRSPRAARTAGDEHRVGRCSPGVERSGRAARAHDAVNLVEKQNHIGIGLGLFYNCRQPLFKFSAVLGAGHQRAHVELNDFLAKQSAGDIALGDARGEASDDGGLTYARIAQQKAATVGQVIVKQSWVPEEVTGKEADTARATADKVAKELPAGHERFMAMNAFFEHLGLVGGFILVAWYDLQRTSRIASGKPMVG